MAPIRWEKMDSRSGAWADVSFRNSSGSDPKLWFQVLRYLGIGEILDSSGEF